MRHRDAAIFDRDDLDLIAALAGCSLDRSPGKNWVEDEGGLPEYICRIARAIHRGGKSISQSIAIAVSRVHKWAAGGDDVDADTRAKAAKALAQWEAMKAKRKGRKGTKKVKTSNVGTRQILCLANVDYNVDIVKRAWEERQRTARKAWRSANPNNYDCPEDLYIREQWTNYLIVSNDYRGTGALYKVPFTVDKDSNITFSDPVEVKTKYVVVSSTDLGDGELTDAELKKMMNLTDRADPAALDRILQLSARRTTPLQRVLRAAAKG